jgi:hypothetical protein
VAGAAGSCRGVGTAMPWGLTRARRGGRPEHGGQPIRQLVPQMTAVRSLAGEGGPKARRFRVGLGAIPPVPLAPGMRPQPLGHGRGFPVGEAGQGLPPCPVQEAGAIGRALAQRTIVPTEDLRGDARRAGSAAAHS